MAEDDGLVDSTRSDTHSLTITVVDVNDDSPLFNPSYYVFSVSETATNGHTVDTVTASDADGVTYAINSGNTGGTFRIEAATGEIIVDDDTTLDYDAVAATISYELVIRGNSCYLNKSQFNTLLIVHVNMLLKQIHIGNILYMICFSIGWCNNN